MGEFPDRKKVEAIGGGRRWRDACEEVKKKAKESKQEAKEKVEEVKPHLENDKVWKATKSTPGAVVKSAKWQWDEGMKRWYCIWED